MILNPLTCTIAGSDVSGGAGVQSDLRAFHNLGVHGNAVITAITAQSLNHISEIYYVSPYTLEAQLQSLDDEIRAIKIGMLGSGDTIEVVCHFLKKRKRFTVLDPILISSSGKNLHQGSLSHYLDCLKQLFPLIDVLTPNSHEAEILLNRRIRCHADIEQAARDILAMGVQSVVIKGGHLATEGSDDYWSNGVQSCWLMSSRYENRNVHGTGCVFSSAITACISLGYDLKDALVIAKMYVNRGIRTTEQKDSTTFFQHQMGWPEDEIDLPMLNDKPVSYSENIFPRDDLFQVGLYPVVDTIEWLHLLMPLDIKCIQLRIKDKKGEELKSIIKQSVMLAQQYQVKLFVNDYWEYAIECGAYGVHLGQEDLSTADVNAIYAAGLRLGISTHCYEEVARAHYYRPSYIACGPIFTTTSKQMTFAAQGVHALMRWRRTLSYPLVAIGGIHHDNIKQIVATNIDGMALISAITKAENPIMSTKQLIHLVNNHAI